MSDITLTNLTSLANDTSATNSINNNFQTVEDVINDEVAHLTGGNNVMQQDLDMNSNDILNINSGAFTTLTVNGITVDQQAANAAASAAAAATSETNAATSETNAAASASAAAASAASVDVNLDQQNTWTAGQVAATYVATTSGSVALDFSEYNNFIITLNGNITLSNPTTETVGQTGVIVFKQDGTGSRTLTLGTEYLTTSTITLTPTASAIDVIPYIVSGSGEILLGTISANFT